MGNIRAVIHYVNRRRKRRRIDVDWSGILINEINRLRLYGLRFYVEWLDQHNPREVTNESEAGDE